MHAKRIRQKLLHVIVSMYLVQMLKSLVIYTSYGINTFTIKLSKPTSKYIDIGRGFLQKLFNIYRL